MEKEKFGIRFNAPIDNIHRTENTVTLKYRDSFHTLQTENCGFLIWTPPMTELIKYVSSPSKYEKGLFVVFIYVKCLTYIYTT